MKKELNLKPLSIINASENNLKNISLKIPHDQFTVITGLSGSGKSSLAFDTVYAEGQRRYIETFSPYTRQFFDKVKKPQVEKIEHIRPAIAIQQRTRITSSRSTVGSLTNCNDYLKVIWGALSQAHCPTCQKKLIAWNTQDIIKQFEDGAFNQSSFIFIASTIQIHKKYFELEIDRLKTLGFSRIWDPTTQTVVKLSEDEKIKLLKKSEHLTVIIDRVRPNSEVSNSLKTSIDQAFSLSTNSAQIIEVFESGQKQEFKFHTFSKDFVCEEHKFTAKKAKNYLFSFNHPLGACEECKGFGFILELSESKIIPDISKTIQEHAIDCWSGPSAEWEFDSLIKFCKKNKISTSIPWKNISLKQRALIFDSKEKDFWGVSPWFKWLEKKTYKMHVRVFLSRYRSQKLCPSCSGTRLKADALTYKVNNFSIPQIWSMPIDKLLSWTKHTQNELFEIRSTKLSSLEDPLKNLIGRLQYLNDLGLSYLTLDRQARTLSGGETQRVNLATALGSELVSTQFVLDEPSVGLHPEDSDRLLESMQKLSHKGNSLLVVEHDPDVIINADHIIEIGPKSGKDGGQIIFNDEASKWEGIKIAPRIRSHLLDSLEKLLIRKASARNLKNVDISFPLKRFNCLTGVSGSGKSTLVHEVLIEGWRNYLGEIDKPLSFEKIEGFKLLSNVVLVDQSPLSKTPRANIATYTKIWDVIRDLLANTQTAQSLGFTKSTFSFNVDAGRCTSCDGAGFIREDMQFLSDVYVPCEQCLGKRFSLPVLDVTYKLKNVDDYLNMTVDEALAFFEEEKKVLGSLNLLSLLGLGALRLGHPLSELSGGEAQRLKLVPFLSDQTQSNCLFIFDEPTTGLHVHDIERLMGLFNTLVERGHTVLCIEHNLSVIQNADWVIDLGPVGGELGGNLLYCGDYQGFLTSKTSTSNYLNDYIEKTKKIFKAKKSKIIKGAFSESPNLLIQGAKEHNLKNITVSIPSDKIIAITGVSGSGKSTVAKDIIYAEGQRRYLDCLSPYARQFIKELSKPDIASIANVRPTICVYQHTFQPSELSTVATMSEVYNFLRLLYAKAGTQYCPDHPSEKIAPLSAEQIYDQIYQNNSKTIRLLSPVIKLKKGNHRAVFARAIESEILEVRVDGKLGKPSYYLSEELPKTKAHSIDFVFAKFNPKTIHKESLIETISEALSIGGGTVILLTEDGSENILSSKRTCPICQKGFFKPDPEDFSFNSKRGRCTKCDGYGIVDNKPCPECSGARIQLAGRNVRINGKNIHEACSLDANSLKKFLNSFDQQKSYKTLVEPVVKELYSKLDTLIEIGLDYIQLDRGCRTLSGGELQRLRLASAMGSALSGVMYIFDEPSAGLHPQDNEKVLSKIRSLQKNQNSVLIIEHDIQSIKACDHIIDFGPYAGKDGGNVVYNGAIDKYKNQDTPTCIALNTPSELTKRSKYKFPSTLSVKNGNKNNIKNLSLSVPLKSLVSFSGVSGAGKSSLVHGIILETLLNGTGSTVLKKSAFGEVAVSEPIDKIVFIDQQPIGSTSRSTPASYLGIWDEVRKLFATTLDAKANGWNNSFFSYNAGTGRCQTCKGAGLITLEMNFLADAKIVCEACGGLRFSDEALSVKYNAKSVSDLLSMTFEEAKSFFTHHRKMHHILKSACDLGLGYLTIGQSSTTLSGGEAQRLKIVSELATQPRGHTLYILDEPTIGLHRYDVSKLLISFRSLVERGSTVFIIEHDIDTLNASDYVIELGPGAGENGGKIISSGLQKSAVFK